MTARKGRRGPAGTRIYKGRRPSGRTPGVPATKAEAKAARVAALKHGGRALVVTAQEARGLALKKRFGEGAQDVLDQYHKAISEGDTSGTDALAERGLSELELIRQDLAGHVARDGSVITEEVIGGDGNVIGSRRRLHPGVEQVARYSELLGHTSVARRLDPKSRGEGAKDDAVAKMLARDNLLRSLPAAKKDAMAPPPPDDDVIDSEIVAAAPGDPK